MRDAKAEILHFWFEETQPRQWFQKNDDFDMAVSDRFLPLYKMARDGLCDAWANEPLGCLALCILLDQFPRNIFRDSAEAFATDPAALDVSRRAIAKGFDQALSTAQRRFLYLPFEHSESIEDQARSVDLFAAMKDGDPLGYDYALRHYDIVKRFGRFPHRNAVLSRESTAEELDYLNTPGAGF